MIPHHPQKLSNIFEAPANHHHHHKSLTTLINQNFSQCVSLLKNQFLLRNRAIFIQRERRKADLGLWALSNDVMLNLPRAILLYTRDYIVAKC